MSNANLAILIVIVTAVFVISLLKDKY